MVPLYHVPDLETWRKLGSFVALILLGLHLYIWSGRRMEVGVLVEIIDD